MDFANPRAIDHLVLPTDSLDVARSRLSALGFTVAPNGAHPFGTENCCVYFEDGTYLEPLALADDRVAREAARLGNVFTARDAAYRFRQGEEGFSAVAFSTTDAAADHAIFTEEGVSAGSMLEFSRPFVDADGKSDNASFRLAFAADLKAPDAFFFTCERVNALRIDRASLQAHANGVVGLSSIVLSATPDAIPFAGIVLIASNADAGYSVDGGTIVETANADIYLYDPPTMRRQFGVGSSADAGAQLRAIVFKVTDLKVAATLLADRKIAHKRYGSRLVILPAPGQGAIFAFEAP